MSVEGAQSSTRERLLEAAITLFARQGYEATFESRSYGFRLGRSCQDAMQAIFVTARGATCKRL